MSDQKKKKHTNPNISELSTNDVPGITEPSVHTLTYVVVTVTKTGTSPRRGAARPLTQNGCVQLFRQGSWALDTNGLDGTKLIAASFNFRAYFLHPAVKSAFQTVRAYRAWRAIEKHQIVEVTKYSLAAEILRGRGRWDAERITTVILAVFSLASFGLEISVGLAYCEGDEDILHRPPPAVFHKMCRG